MKTNTKILVLRYLLWAAVLAVMIIIFIFSSKTAEQSSNSSRSFAKTLLSVVVPGFTELSEEAQQAAVDSIQFIVRKGAHFAVFLTLGALCQLAMNTYNIKLKRRVITALSISFVYAVSDEVHQTFVPGRAGQIRDVMIDFAGALTGVALVCLLVWLCFKIRSKRGINFEKKSAN